MGTVTYSEGVGKAAVTWDELKEQVEQAGGVVTLTMATLRDAEGAGKLGVHVRGNISRRLAAGMFQSRRSTSTR